jgi:hypothetical protein
VQHVLAAFEDGRFIDQVPEGYEKWKEAVRKKPLTRLRALIRALRASGRRREAFQDCIREGNQNSHFVDPEARECGEENVVQVPECALLRDVDTRWDSVYHMISRARTLRPVRPFVAELISIFYLITCTGH